MCTIALAICSCNSDQLSCVACETRNTNGCLVTPPLQYISRPIRCDCLFRFGTFLVLAVFRLVPDIIKDLDLNKGNPPTHVYPTGRFGEYLFGRSIIA